MSCLLQLKGTVSDAQMERYLEFVEDRPYNDLRYAMDSSKLHQLGWTPKVSWDDGMMRTSKSRGPTCFGVALIL